MIFLRSVMKCCIRIAGAVVSRMRNYGYRILGVEIEGYAWLRDISIPRGWQSISLGVGVALDSGVTLIVSGEGCARQIRIGSRTYVNRGCIFDSSECLSIGEDCMIGPYCYLTDHDHGVEIGKPPADQALIEAPTTVGDRVWLGANVTILKGVSIGDDAVVAAGAVVTRNVAAGARVAGVPARLIGKCKEDHHP